MKNLLFCVILIISSTLTRAKDEELPLCPTNFQYFPQTLPMHCRMPTGADFPSYPGMPSMTIQPPPADKQPMPIPVPMPPSMSMPMPGAMPMLGSMMPGTAPAHKLPVIVMPFYSPDTSFKKPERPNRPGGPGWKKPKRPHESAEANSDTDTSSDTSGTDSSENGWWKGKKHGWKKNGRRSSKRHHSHHPKRRHNKKKKDLLTPVLQYVTNDGYVIYEKKISKGEAKDWLRVNKEEQKPEERNEGKDDDGLDASVHKKQKTEIEEVYTKRGWSREDDGENDEERDKETRKDEEEVTTPKVHLRRHHRKGIAPAINKLLSKRPF